MEDFSRSDQLKAILSPFCCCMQRSALRLSPSSDEINQQQQGIPSSDSRNPFADQPGGTNDLTGRSRTRTTSGEGGEREEDSWSLHSRIEGSVGSSRRLRTRGGDISGGGASEGSGLTRWTLFKSWLGRSTTRGGEGAIRLEEDENETVRLDSEDQTGETTFVLDEEEDAVPLQLNQLEISSERSRSQTSSTRSDGTTAAIHEEDEVDDREARRARRRAKRRARELGISVQEFEQGVSAPEPQEADEEDADSTFLQVQSQSTRRSRSEKNSKSSRTSSSSTSSRSRDHGTSSTMPTLLEDGSGGGYSNESTRRSRNKSKKGPSDGDRHSNDSSSHSRRSRRNHDQLADPHSIPLPVSPQFEVAPRDSPKRSRHRSQPSTSTVSSSSTSCRPKKQPHLSPLHDPSQSVREGGVEYYEDENGQLQPYPSSLHESPHDSNALSPSIDFESQHCSPSTSSYDHVGILPPPSPSSQVSSQSQILS
ncbi:hypothetical protein JCM5350_004042 [Sporobolomyces pararoseus]